MSLCYGQQVYVDDGNADAIVTTISQPFFEKKPRQTKSVFINQNHTLNCYRSKTTNSSAGFWQMSVKHKAKYLKVLDNSENVQIMHAI